MAVAYKKRLEGVKPTDELKSLLKKSLSKAEALSTKGGDDEDDDVSPCLPFSSAKAASVLKAYKKDGNFIPIAVIRAMETVLKDESTSEVQLQKALTSTSLVFTPPPQNLLDDAIDESTLTPEQRKFRQRMQRLRFKNEQTKYSKLTNNLGMNVVQDDVTTKSMTYAASIGLNMIVAPISFGVFMYFFAGSLFDFFWPTSQRSALAGQPDIRRVIAGVISGVLMLFVEMLLFVIRTNELDKAVRKKQKKNKNQGPFGYYTSSTNKTFQDR